MIENVKRWMMDLRCGRKSCTDTEYATVFGKEEMLQYTLIPHHHPLAFPSFILDS